MDDNNVGKPINRSFVGNENDIRQFYGIHIAPFENTSFYAHLIIPIARRKYYAPLSQSQISLSTTIFHARKGADEFIRTLKRYNVDDDVFVDSKDANIPRDAIVLYMTVNPMDEMRAYNLLQKTMNERLYDMARHASTPPFNVYKEYKSVLHQCPSAKFIKYDVDSKEKASIDALRTLAREKKISFHLVVETKNGFHVVLSNETSFQKNKEGGEARRALSDFVEKNKEWIQKNEPGAQIVIPGTYQGGFLAKIVDWNEK